MRTLCVVGLCWGCAAEELAPNPPEIDWYTPLDATVGLSDPALEGHSLAEIVGGEVFVEAEGGVCSDCHFTDTITLYRPPITQHETASITPRDVVGGRSWAGTGGWAERYVALGPNAIIEKPPELRGVFELWLASEAERVQPLSWHAPMSEQTLGVEPDEALRGTLDQIVNSLVSGRPDALMCSECHYEGGPAAYRPPIPQGAPSDFAPDEVIDGASWRDGWADRFIEHGPGEETEKPAYLRAVLNKWLQDGAR